MVLADTAGTLQFGTLPTLYTEAIAPFVPGRFEKLPAGAGQARAQTFLQRFNI